MAGGRGRGRDRRLAAPCLREGQIPVVPTSWCRSWPWGMGWPQRASPPSPSATRWRMAVSATSPTQSPSVLPAAWRLTGAQWQLPWTSGRARLGPRRRCRPPRPAVLRQRPRRPRRRWQWPLRRRRRRTWPGDRPPRRRRPPPRPPADRRRWRRPPRPRRRAPPPRRARQQRARWPPRATAARHRQPGAPTPAPRHPVARRSAAGRRHRGPGPARPRPRRCHPTRFPAASSRRPCDEPCRGRRAAMYRRRCWSTPGARGHRQRQPPRVAPRRRHPVPAHWPRCRHPDWWRRRSTRHRHHPPRSTPPDGHDRPARQCPAPTTDRPTPRRLPAATKPRSPNDCGRPRSCRLAG